MGNNSQWTNSGGARSTQNKTLAVGYIAGGGATITINGSGFGTKVGAPYFEDFESIPLQSYGAATVNIGSLIGSWGLGLSISNTRASSGTRSLRSDFSAGLSGSGIDFPKVYYPLSATRTRAYLSCKLWIEGNGTVHIYKFARAGAVAADVYGGHPHAGASYNPSFDINSFGGEMIDGNDVTVGYGANNAANPNNFATAFVKNQWLFYEAEIYTGTLNNADAVYLETVNGLPTTIWTAKTYLTTANSQLPAWFISPLNGWDQATDNRGYMDDFYGDESRARVVMTNNATYGSSTKFEIQPIVSWATNQIVVTKRGGSSFSAGNSIWLHVFDNTGTEVLVQSGTF